MATPVSKVIQDAQVVLNDAGAVRWTVPELIGYINDGQRALVVARPDETATVREFLTVAGARQTVPEDAHVLIEVVRSLSTGRAITPTNRSLLDAVVPGWTGARRPARTLQHYMYDLKEPRTFWLYPVPAADTPIEVVLSLYPQQVVEGGDLTVSDKWAEPITNYVLARSFAKELPEASVARALAYAQLFNTATGAQLQAAAAASA